MENHGGRFSIYFVVFLAYLFFSFSFTAGVGEDFFNCTGGEIGLTDILSETEWVPGVENILNYSSFPLSSSFVFLLFNASVVIVGIWIAFTGRGGFTLPDHDRLITVIFSAAFFPGLYFLMMVFFMSDPYGASKASSLELKMAKSPLFFSIAVSFIASFNAFGCALFFASIKKFTGSNVLSEG